MKSIKEQANEYADNHGFRVPYDGSNNFYDVVDVKASKEGFMVGANYVLDHLSKTISVSDDGHLRDNLKKMIEQLKKK